MNVIPSVLIAFLNDVSPVDYYGIVQLVHVMCMPANVTYKLEARMVKGE